MGENYNFKHDTWGKIKGAQIDSSACVNALGPYWMKTPSPKVELFSSARNSRVDGNVTPRYISS